MKGNAIEHGGGVTGMMRRMRKRAATLVSRLGSDRPRRREVVLIVYHHLRLGGVERKIADIAGELAGHPLARGRDFYLVLDEGPPAEPGERHFYDAVHASPIVPLYRPQETIRGIGCPYSLFVLWQALRLRPRTVVAFLRRPGVYAILLKALLPWRRMKVFVSDDTIPSRSLAQDTRDRPLKRLVATLLIRACYPWADGIVVPSERARQDLVSRFSVPARRVVVNRNWTPLDRTIPSLAEEETYDLVYVGRIDLEKNLGMLVDVVADASRRFRPVRACVVGSGTRAEEVAAHAARRDVAAQIDFVGPQRRVESYLHRSKIFCMTSTFEGLPIAGLEAMAAGLPVLVTNYPGADELVVDGVTGYVCESREEYVERVIELLSDPVARRALGRAGATRVRRRHGRRNLERFIGMFGEPVPATGD
ncbi:MAG: glycosyltransferase family 4 protein [Gemmatimonadota bacterium]|nr:glycosyltransferase family 4 protein [Gemmatimonadota bacterium]